MFTPLCPVSAPFELLPGRPHMFCYVVFAMNFTAGSVSVGLIATQYIYSTEDILHGG